MLGSGVVLIIKQPTICAIFPFNGLANWICITHCLTHIYVRNVAVLCIAILRNITCKGTGPNCIWNLTCKFVHMVATMLGSGVVLIIKQPTICAIFPFNGLANWICITHCLTHIYVRNVAVLC